MNKVLLVLIACLILLLTLPGCSTERVVTSDPSPVDIEEWDTSDWPQDISWTSPPKTWIDDFHPGDTVDFLLLLHTPLLYSVQKLVTTTTPEEGENGILLQKLAIPVKAGTSDMVEVVSSHEGDNLTVTIYNPFTNTLTISGFEMVKLDRIISISYVPDTFTWLVYWKKPYHPDSGKELIGVPTITLEDGTTASNFVSVAESARWFKFQNGINRITVSSEGATTTKILVNLTVPEDVILPEYWEFWIGAGDITGQAEQQAGVIVGVENVYKILVTSNTFEFRPEPTTEE